MTEIPPDYDIEEPERTRLAQLAERTDTDGAVGTFKALTDPIRVTVLRLLAERPLCVCVLVDVLDSEYSKLSYHLKVLRNAGLVSHEREGSFSEYRLTPQGRDIATLVDSVVADARQTG